MGADVDSDDDDELVDPPWMRASRTPTSLAGRSELSTMHVAAAETETVTPPSRAGVAQAL